MRGLFEFSGFLGASVAAHLVLWQEAAPQGTPASAGAGGAATITLTGAPQTLAALVDAWERPPEFMVDPSLVAMPAAPDQPAMPLTTPQPVVRQTPMAPPRAPTVPGMVPSAPQVDLASPPAPRSSLAPDTSPRPTPRPDLAQRAPKSTPKAQPKAKPQRAAAPKQTAAGRGGKVAAGKARTSGTGAQKSTKATADLIARWGGSIRARVERRKRYPSGTSGNGKVRLWLKVTTTGQLASAGLTRSSGNPAFDRAALSAVRRAALPRAPGGIAPGAYRFTLSMSFSR